MTTIMGGAIELRPATMAEADRLLDWVNMPDSLAGKLATSAPIDRSSHRDWLARRVADPATRLWIIEHDGDAVGQIRLQHREGAWEVDVYVAAGHRGRGYARSALEAGFAALAAAPFAARARARVRTGNTASRRLFATLGFRVVATHSDHIVFERDLAPETRP